MPTIDRERIHADILTDRARSISGEHEMKELHVEGRPFSINRCPEPEGTPFEVAHDLFVGNMGLFDALPDSAKVTLSEVTVEEYIPPRCRKPRKRRVATPIMTWTLGEFRSKQAGS